ncbi:MAG: hypothetical protein PWR20_1495 [Bacteroidales bacterium]|nr:hypothetical protein [Bacteroidales bacterium]MDN5330284.1 hypothetical protein [Bacteroidales bacterium]
MKAFSYFLTVALLLLGFSSGYSQEPTPDYIIGTKNPKKATLLSMALPGLGQAYNGKYWKIPVIYAGLGATGYFALSNRSEYRKFRAAYQYKVFNLPGDPPNEYATLYTADQLRVQRDYYRRNMEFNYILAVVVYILNMVDAAVDAHLSAFDISDDLSLRVAPDWIPCEHEKSLAPAFAFKFTCSF